jgi:DNA polymerase
MLPIINHPIPKDIDFKAWILSMPVVTLDIETYYDGEVGFSKMTTLEYVQHPKFKIQGISVAIDDVPDGKAYPPKYFRTVEAAIEYMRSIIGHHGETKWAMNAHNTKFDAYSLFYHLNMVPTVYLDTQSMSKGLWPFESASLANLAKRLWPNDDTRRKGHELVQSKGVWEWSDEMHETVGEIYCNNDVQLTRDAFWEMFNDMPSEELEIIHITTRMMAYPVLTADHEILKEVMIYEAEERRKMGENAIALANQAVLDKGLDYWNPDPAEAKKKTPLSKTLFTSRNRFIAFLVEILEMKLPTKTKVRSKDGSSYETFALAKNDPERLELEAQYPEYDWVFRARDMFASNQSSSRAKRMMDVTPDSRGNEMSIPLGYYNAHTGRYGGEEKLNMQNLGRGSKHRLALYAPKKFKVHVSDSSNVEARINAEFSKQEDLLEAFRNKRDVYSEFASDAFGVPVNKKDNPFERGAGKVCVLGLGYGMGAPTLKRTFAAGPMGMPPTNFEISVCQRMVNVYRSKNYMIVDSWKQAGKAIETMIMLKDGEHLDWNCLRIESNKIRLPNGMYLNYPKLHYNSHYESFVYWNGMFWKRIYGGALIENIVQALARIVVMRACVAIDRLLQTYGGWIVMQVHDENIGVARDLGEDGNNELFNKITEIMCIPPDFAPELPLDAEGGFADNYSK